MKKTPPLLFLELCDTNSSHLPIYQSQPWDKGLPNVLGFFPDHVCHSPSAHWDASWPLPCLVQLWWVAERRGGGSSPSLAVPCLAHCCSLAPWPWHLLSWFSHPGDWVPVAYSLLPCIWLMLRAFNSVSQVRLWLGTGCEPSALQVCWVEAPITQSSQSRSHSIFPPQAQLCCQLACITTLPPDDPHLQWNLAEYDGRPSLQNVHGSTLKKCKRKRLIDFIAQESNKHS